jgi:hypothetical protein
MNRYTYSYTYMYNFPYVFFNTQFAVKMYAIDHDDDDGGGRKMSKIQF